MVDTQNNDDIVKNEIKDAMEKGYLPFTWDSCFGFKFSTTNDTTSTFDNGINNNEQNNYNCQCGAKNAFKNVNCSENAAYKEYININENDREVNIQNEKYNKNFSEKKKNYKMCILEVQKIKALLDRVKNGDLTPRRSKHNQVIKEMIQASLFEKWNATKTLKNMSSCNILRTALQTAETSRIPTILSKAIKQGFTDNELLHEYAQVVNAKLNEYSVNQLTSILKSFSIPPYKNFEFFSKLCERIMFCTRIPDFNLTSKNVSDFITSCGRLYYNDRELIQLFSRHIMPNAETYRPKDLANIYHSLAKLRINNSELFKFISNVLIPYFYDLSPICLVNLLVSYSRTGLDDKESIYALIEEIDKRIEQMDPMDLLRITMALSCLINDKLIEYIKIENCMSNLLKRLYETCWPLGYVQNLVLLESLIRLKAFDNKLIYGKILPSLLTKRSIIENKLLFSENVRTIECIASLPSVNETAVKLIELSVKRIPKIINLDGNLIARLLSALNKLNYESEDIDKKISELATPRFLESLDETYRNLIINVVNKVKNTETSDVE